MEHAWARSPVGLAHAPCHRRHDLRSPAPAGRLARQAPRALRRARGCAGSASPADRDRRGGVMERAWARSPVGLAHAPCHRRHDLRSPPSVEIGAPCGRACTSGSAGGELAVARAVPAPRTGIVEAVSWSVRGQDHRWVLRTLPATADTICAPFSVEICAPCGRACTSGSAGAAGAASPAASSRVRAVTAFASSARPWPAFQRRSHLRTNLVRSFMAFVSAHGMSPSLGSPMSLGNTTAPVNDVLGLNCEQCLRSGPLSNSGVDITSSDATIL
jgi:hypothetical protein